MKFTKVLLHKRQNLIDSEISGLQLQKKYFQEYLNKVELLGIELLENDLIPLFENPKSFITDKLTKNETLKVGNLTLNKEKLFDLIEKPDGTNELINSIIIDKQSANINQQCIWLANRFLINGKKVVINPLTVDEITNRHSLFIESENQQNGYNKLLQLAELIAEINEISINKINLDTKFSELINLNGTPTDTDTGTANKNGNKKSHKPQVNAIKRFV